MCPHWGQTAVDFEHRYPELTDGSGYFMTSLTRSEKILCGLYATVAVIALIATWWNNIAFFQSTAGGGVMDFLQAGYANYASSSLTNDLALAALVALVFMVVEARRIGMRHVWVYVVVSGAVAISVGFPLYLIARQVTLANARSAGPHCT